MRDKIRDTLRCDESSPRRGQDLAGLMMNLVLEVSALNLVCKRQNAQLAAIEQRLAQLEARRP
jgi:hypothetical protein